MSHQVISFWRPIDPNGFLGQWYESQFDLRAEDINKFPFEITKLNIFRDYKISVLKKLCNNVFLNVEQFMMMGKAALFNDREIFQKMKGTPSPKTLKALGRKVKNFDEERWKRYSQDLVIIGNYLKFNKIPELKELILSTENKILVEGSPYDKIWGVGIRFDHKNINDPLKWKGQNKLGKSLMYVRSILYAQQV